jgi:general stress protein 13/S1 RNA binding domain protein
MSEIVEVGSIIEGKIVRIKPFGVIVSFGNKQGLVHISQVANSFIEDINNHVKVGDVVKAKVLSVDEATNKIALSMRDALPKEERNNDNPFKKSFSKPFQKTSGPSEEYPRGSKPASGGDFEDKMKEWMKQSTERQTSLNKRTNKRSY